MAVSADALEEDWWLDPEEREDYERPTKRKGSQDTEKVKKKKRKIISEELSKKGTSFVYRPAHQREQMWSFLCARLKDSTTAVEMDQFKLPGKCFVGYHGEEEDSDTQPEFNQYFSKVCSNIDKWTQRLGDQRGSPCVIIICSSATRALELRQQLMTLCGIKNVTKLFAKHMKIEDQKKLLSESVVSVAVATPDRLVKLLDEGSLYISKLKRIIFDWNWRNQKLKRLIDIPEVSKAVGELYKEHLNPIIIDNNSKLKLSLY